MCKWFVLFTFLISIIFSYSIEARTVWVGRYLSVMHRSDLQILVTRRFPKRIRTIGAAIRYTLRGTHYRLLAMSQTSKTIKKMYRQPLPGFLRHVGPISLQHALLSLSGNQYQLVVDPKYQLITYKIKQDKTK